VQQAQPLRLQGVGQEGCPRRVAAGLIETCDEAGFDWIEAADYYACLHVGTRTHLLRRSMSELEQELSSDMFCRIHRSTIVNLDRVRDLKLSEDGEYEVVLEAGTRLPLSRRYRGELQDRLKRRH